MDALCQCVHVQHLFMHAWTYMHPGCVHSRMCHKLQSLHCWSKHCDKLRKSGKRRQGPVVVITVHPCVLCAKMHADPFESSDLRGRVRQQCNAHITMHAWWQCACVHARCVGMCVSRLSWNLCCELSWLCFKLLKDQMIVHSSGCIYFCASGCTARAECFPSRFVNTSRGCKLNDLHVLFRDRNHCFLTVKCCAAGNISFDRIWQIFVTSSR